MQAFFVYFIFFNKNLYKDNIPLVMLDCLPPPLCSLAYSFSLIIRKRNNVLGIIHHFPVVKKSMSFNRKIYNFCLIIFLNIMMFRGCKILTHTKHNADSKRIKYLNYGINSRKLIRNYDSPRHKILFFGGLSVKKGIPRLIRVAKLLSHQGFEFNIFGKNIDINENELMQISKSYENINIKVGFIPDSNISKIFYKNDILVLPYSENWEGTSGPLHLAIEYGLPIVCSKAPQLEYMVKKYDIGIVTDDNRDSSLVKALLNIRFNQKDYKSNFLEGQRSNSFMKQSKTIIKEIQA